MTITPDEIARLRALEALLREENDEIRSINEAFAERIEGLRADLREALALLRHCGGLWPDDFWERKDALLARHKEDA